MPSLYQDSELQDAGFLRSVKSIVYRSEFGKVRPLLKAEIKITYENYYNRQTNMGYDNYSIQH